MAKGYADWTLFSHHGAVLFYLAAYPDTTMKDLATIVGISERHVARIIRDLIEAGMLSAERKGRRNSYRVNAEQHFRHAAFSSVAIRDVAVRLAAALGHAMMAWSIGVVVLDGS